MPQPARYLGFDRGLELQYDLGEQLGKGGNGVVRVATDRATGEQYACKAIRKQLGPEASEKKVSTHIESIRREVEALRRLEGSLNVVRLVAVYEDDENVYLVQELCRGGELWHRIGEKHYSERTVASYMRAVLRTLAQCHSHHILHRDVKPGNFMLLDDSERSPLKAIDFGLAVPFEPDNLPITDLGLEGTPWYMAPEVLSSQVTPASDIWSAGVMAAQLLTGRCPFDDHRNPFAPSLSAVWRSVLTGSIDYNMPWWAGISADAKDFVDSLLQREPGKRPTAREALRHPWLNGTSAERSTGKQLEAAVVQRIQRFAQNSRFKRSVLQMIAEELLAAHAASAAVAAGGGSAHGGGSAGGSTRSRARRAAAAALAAAAAAAEEARSRARGIAPVIEDPAGPLMQRIFDRLQFTGDAMPVPDAAAALVERAGYRLRPCEAARLVAHVADAVATPAPPSAGEPPPAAAAPAPASQPPGQLRRAAFAASQMDWRRVQQDHVGEWLDLAAAAFASLDTDGDGVLRWDEIANALRAALPDEEELRDAVARVFDDAGGLDLPPGVDSPQAGMDFDGFMRMLKVGSADSLELYDDRTSSLGSPASSMERLSGLLAAGSDDGIGDGSTHAAGRPSAAAAVAAAPQKPWLHRSPPNFRFDFGGYTGPAHAHPRAPTMSPVQPPAPPVIVGSEAGGAAHPPRVEQGAAASYFASGRSDAAARGGGHFDRRMHGAKLYHNAVVQGGATRPLATVRE